MTATNMQPLVMAEGTIAVPEGYADRTTQVLAPETDRLPSLTIARDRMQAGEGLDAYVERQIALMKKRYSGYTLVQRQAAVLGDGQSTIDGLYIDAIQTPNGRRIYQRQAVFEVQPGLVLVLTAASSRPFDDVINRLWAGWLGSYAPVPLTS